MEGGTETQETGRRGDGAVQDSGNSGKNPGVLYVTLADGQTLGLTAGPTEQPDLMTQEPTCAFQLHLEFCQWHIRGEDDV